MNIHELPGHEADPREMTCDRVTPAGARPAGGKRLRVGLVAAGRIMEAHY